MDAQAAQLAQALVLVMAALKNPPAQKSLFSQSWYRVAELKPRLRSHTRFHHHVYRGRDWYILQDDSTGRFHRFSREAYFIVGLMDGRSSMHDIWEAACTRLGDDMPTQDEVINLLSYLHRSDALQTDKPPDMDDFGKRSRQEKTSRWIAMARSPAAMSFPIWDPDSFLDKSLFLVRPFLSRTGVLLWGVLLAVAVVLVGMHWQELSSDVTDRVLATENLFLLALIYPFSRLFHEFGHAYAVKRWGGEVHEMGVMLIVFMPLPYVDASWSSAFPQKGRRMFVGAAGIMADILLASISILVWVLAEPGTVRAIAYNLMFIAGLSTLLLNGNPLLRFDSYYILADFIDIPNLADRANKYLGYLIKFYLLRIKDALSPVQAPGERKWLCVYALASFVYRIFITVGIFLFVAGKFFALGVLLALWAAFSMIVLPLFKVVRHVLSEMRERAPRAALVAAAVICPLLAFAFWFPLPSSTVAQGVVWVPEESQVYAGTDGFVVKVLVAPGSRVSRGDPLVYCDAPELKAEMNVLRASLREVEARLRVSFVTDRTQTEILKDEMAGVHAKLARAEERMSEMIVRSPALGIFLLPEAEDLPGRFVRRGTPLGYVVDFSRTVVRVIVNQADVEHIRHRTTRVEARLVESPSSVVPAFVEREVPAASKDLPSLALSVQGGGSVAVDPKATRSPQAFENLFHFDIVLPQTIAKGVGERVFVRFVHTPEPLIARWHRAIRRVLLRRLSV